MFGKSLDKQEANFKQKSDENKDKYKLGVTSWSITKFSVLTSQELYGRQ